MRVVALVVAAGSGERLGAAQPKALVECGGRPLLDWSLDALAAAPSVGQIIVALPAGVDAAVVLPACVAGVEGGAQRSHSVRAALDAADPGAEYVLVHDAARPLIAPEEIEQVIEAAQADGVDGAIAAAPVTDTIKQVESGGHTVARTLDRSALWSVQTPQVFRRAMLQQVLGQPDHVVAAATDDASLVEAAGGRVVVVPTSAQNIKVTTPLDLQLAELLLSQR
jgi:2-C-methyl-D-erythritol 4-phosphate cytidylyltransferase